MSPWPSPLLQAPSPVPSTSPTPPDRPPAPGATPARPFADVLRQSRLDRSPAPAVAVAPPEAAPGGGADDASEVDAEAREPARARARSAAAPGAARRAGVRPSAVQSAGGAPEGRESPATPAPERDAVPASPALLHPQGEPAPGAIADRRALAARTTSDDAGLDGSLAATADATGEALPRPAAGGPVAGRPTRHADDANDPAPRDRRATDASAPDPIAAGGGPAPTLERLAAARPLDGGGGALLPAFAPASPAAPGTATPLDAATAGAGFVATPVDAPEFAAALGLQVSILARDGVQAAELRLNPAEMGPVSVTIELVGAQARVDFGADVAATRQAIERGLAELAAALSEAGFTLTGGGVSSQARGRDAGGERGPHGPARIAARSADALAASALAATRRTGPGRAGGVDLYA